ncbi:MAG: hypothetical protein Q9201_006509 [Fulgogasparrea decipioides]
MAGAVEQTLASKASHESFHSTYSQQPPSPLFSSASNQLATDLHTAALQAAGLPIYDIESYLNDPQHQPTLKSPSAKSPPSKKQKIQGDSSSSLSTPVQLGAPKTTHHVPALHHLCQDRGLVAKYDIDGDQLGGFNGTVTVGDQVISSEQRWPNKKEAKEGLAVLAMPVVRDMEAVKRDKQISSISSREQEKNWIGMLLGMSIHNTTTPSTPRTPPPALPTPNTPSASISPPPALSPTTKPSVPPTLPSAAKKQPAPLPQRKPSNTSSPPATSTPTAVSKHTKNQNRTKQAPVRQLSRSNLTA